MPDLVLNEEEPTYGKYGMLRKQFLKEHRPNTVSKLVIIWQADSTSESD